MSAAVAEVADILVREAQLRVTHAEAAAALRRVMNTPVIEARGRLRFGPGRTCEQIARMLDRALVEAEREGVEMADWVVGGGKVLAAEHIIRVRRKAHGLADWISSPTSDVTVVLRPASASPVRPDEDGVEVCTELPEPAPSAMEPENAEEQAVRQALVEVLDPDLGVNIVDMGFVRRVKMDATGFATITMTLTTPTCPLAKVMTDQMRTALTARNTDFSVQWEWQPSWRPQDISPAGRAQLSAIGFNAF